MNTKLEALAWVIKKHLPEMGPFTTHKLGGESNASYRISSRSGSWVLRIPCRDTQELVNRTNERHNHTLAAHHGLAPKFYAFDPKSGEMITPFLENAPHLTLKKAKEHNTLVEVGHLLRKLHRIDGHFLGVVSPGILNARYTQRIHDQGLALPPAFSISKEEFHRILAIIHRSPWPLVPSHNDATLGNLLRGERLWLIDWEYASMNSPAWDLATYSLDAQLNDTQLEVLLKAWGGVNPQPKTTRRVRLYEQLITHIWTLWRLCLNRPPLLDRINTAHGASLDRGRQC